MPKLRRTVLYIPADNARALAKAAELPADAVIVDLEDAVAPDRKAAARDAARQAVETLTPLKEVALRVNGADTEWHAQDVALAAGLAVPVVLPKVKTADDVARLAAAAGTVWPMLETAEGVWNALAIARAAVASGGGAAATALIVGTNDLALELGADPGVDRANLAFALQAIVLAGRAAGADVIDGVMNDFRDEAGLVAEAKAGRALGMTGKTVIHPAQIGPVNAAFAPSEGEVAHARAVVAAMEEADAAGRSVATLNGRMVERLHADAARRVLALAEAVAGSDAP
ncbi:CoA ester lyase [Acuticoccus sp. I52.16.1]|uniref:HpcH/HpaI aldolase/citrate lyase family protein n=1 Tax=Acuticoccus sp. I52.16.1 TaxID=2928472 RepID=UPI001FD412CE|nr:CoA ester lyase [Acuticoccus sp. I52.16.1]UOM36335.1 CoA ester lyase [Acuticoccus sp. I52.16.1]